MSIRTDTLDTWTNYDSAPINTAQDTHEHIRDRLEDADSRLNDRGEMRFDTLLQGSYANTTIIHDSSDVDVLVRMNNPYKGNITSRLSNRLQERYREEATYFDGDYSIEDFQQDVYIELQDIYGSPAVTRYNKALVIDSDHCQLQMDADVVPCQQYRIYTSFNGDQNDPSNYYQGIRFNTRGGTEITSFPERHMEHGEDMNDECDGNYKETIRMFKNARDWLIDHDRLDEGTAPSYYVECLLYNVPSARFRTRDLQDRYSGIVSYLDDASFQTFRAQNEIENLFGRGETQWRSVEALRFVNQLQWLWENGAY